MKKIFQSTNFHAAYNDATEMWIIYEDNIKVASLYDDSGHIKFTDSSVTFSRDELKELIKLSSEIENQYTQLNG